MLGADTSPVLALLKSAHNKQQIGTDIHSIIFNINWNESGRGILFSSVNTVSMVDSKKKKVWNNNL